MFACIGQCYYPMRRLFSYNQAKQLPPRTFARGGSNQINNQIGDHSKTMRLYNSLTRQVQSYTLDHDPLTMYVCGITPYDTTHLGHAFTYAMADILVRFLESRGHTVRYVQNVTDIDDDILRKANETGEDWLELGNRWTAHFIRDMQTLNVRPPDEYPRATEVIPAIVEAVEALVAKGQAYVANGSVYYDVDAFDDFGKLSDIPRSEMLAVANERGNRPDAPGKQDPLDFVLWQAHAPGEPSWDSPWGPGRPGWHIECSTMAAHYLGHTIDFHGGGSDLIFPHHECEIAQIEPLSGKKPYVRCWFHTAMVEHEGEKMSKSLGNLVMARDLLQEYSPDALRHYLADHHYRVPWAYDQADLDHSTARAEALRQAVSQSGHAGGPALDIEPLVNEFTAAMEDDLDTPRALQLLDQMAQAIQDAQGHQLDAAQDQLRRHAAIFGLVLDRSEPNPSVVDGWNVHLRKFT